MYSEDGRFELVSFYDGTYIEIYDGQDVIFQGSQNELKGLLDLIQKELDNHNKK